jgi:hypothetical protein
VATPDVELATTRTAVLAAIDAGDLTTALRGCIRALAILATIPDSEVQFSRLYWKRDAIVALMEELKRQGATAISDSSSGTLCDAFSVCNVEYVGIRDRHNCGGGDCGCHR